MAAVFYTFLSVMVLTTFYHPGWTEEATGPELQDGDIAMQIHQFVLHLMECHLSPALTLAVVKDGRVLLASGYGFTSTNKSRSVTSETKFAIGSLTKAFTSTLVANWVYKQPKITFDTPVQSFYPTFQVADEQRSSKATLRDLLSHRMGLPSYFKPLLMGFPLDVTRDELVKRLAFMPSGLSFREKFVYNNYMYTLAAHVIEKMSGNRKWEELIHDAFLAPLNMNNTGFLYNIKDFSNFALPCAMLNGSIVDLPTGLFKTVSPCGPAGSIYSTSEDMAKWMTFLLSDGLGPGNKVVVDPEVIRMTREPGMLSSLPFEELNRPKFPVSHVIQSYDMGWLTANYRGYRKIYHTGGVVTHSSRLWLYPDIRAGIYINVNGPQEKDNKHSLLESLMYFVSDLLLGEKPWLKKDVICQLLSPLQQSTFSEVSQASSTHVSTADLLQDNSQESTDLSPYYNATQLSQFVGNYSHKCFGNIEISCDAKQDNLIFKFGQFGWMILRQKSELDFRGHYFGPLSYMNPELGHGDLVRFSQNSKGVVDGLLYSMDIPNNLIEFERDMNGRNWRSGDLSNDDSYNKAKSQTFSLILLIGCFVSSLLPTFCGQLE